jgi:hypothetical protein
VVVVVWVRRGWERREGGVRGDEVELARAAAAAAWANGRAAVVWRRTRRVDKERRSGVDGVAIVAIARSGMPWDLTWVAGCLNKEAS